MQHLVVAGGAGQETAAAALRLAYLTGIRLPPVSIFDSDVAPKAPDSGIQTRTQVLRLLEDRLRTIGVADSEILHFYNPSVLEDSRQAVRTADDVFSRYGNVTADDKMLLELLLTPQDRLATIDDGFHGRPALGALVLATAIRSGAFRDFADRIKTAGQSADGVRLVFAGSLSGGTGTAVIPMLMDEVKRLRDQPGAAARIHAYAVLQLPWFELRRVSDDSLSTEPDVDSGMLDRNSVCLIRGYLDKFEQEILTGGVLLGLPAKVTRVSHGGRQQPETPHYVSILAGMHALNLLSPEATQTLLGDTWHGFAATVVGEGPAGLDGPGTGPVLIVNGKLLSLRRIIELALGLVAFTQALLDDLWSVDSLLAHATTTATTIKKLQSAHEREEFKRTVSAFHRHHIEIKDWLRSSLQSMAGSSRADSIAAFVPDQTWDDLFAVSYRRALRALGRARIPAVGRRVISATPGKSIGEGSTGRQAALSLVSEVRAALLKRM